MSNDEAYSWKQELLDEGHMTVQELINKLEEVEDKSHPIRVMMQEKLGTPTDYVLSGTEYEIHHDLSLGYDTDEDGNITTLEDVTITIGYEFQEGD